MYKKIFISIHPNYNDNFKYKLFKKIYSKFSKIEKNINYIDNVPNLKKFLTDNHNRYHNYLRISLTEKCNLRCRYCMPEEGIKLTSDDKLLTNSELYKLIKIFIRAGVDKIRLTGGEPTIRKDLVDIIKTIKSFDEIKSIAMTTNGIALKHKLKPLKDAGLDNLNISLDTFVDAKFQFVTRRLGLQNVLESINAALEFGYKDLKINCVVINGFNEDEILDFVEFTKNKNIYVRFIEYMPFDGNAWRESKLITYKDMLERIQTKYSMIKISDSLNDTSKAYQVPGYIGKIGFISSMTNHFCGSCNRLRLTADGNLKVCLFSNKEINLREMIRKEITDDEIFQVIGTAVKGKKFSHDGMHNLVNTKNRPMITIGG